MTSEERQFLLTAAWLFMRHGRGDRAKSLFGAILDDDSRDGVASVALASLLLADGDAAKALELLHESDIPRSLAHAGAVLETRALKLLGRKREAASRWNRYLESSKGAKRKWA